MSGDLYIDKRDTDRTRERGAQLKILSGCSSVDSDSLRVGLYYQNQSHLTSTEERKTCFTTVGSYCRDIRKTNSHPKLYIYIYNRKNSVFRLLFIRGNGSLCKS